jgi:hypothetical protein
MTRHTALDSWEKRGRRGYLFIIGDEMAYGRVKPAQVHAVIGDRINEPLALKAILAELQQKFDVYFILPAAAGHGGDAQILGFWRKLLGQNVIALEDLDAVCETIALTVGLGEQAIDLAEGLDDLAEVGSAAGAAVGKALARLGSPSVVRAAPPAGLDRAEPWDGLVRL